MFSNFFKNSWNRVFPGETSLIVSHYDMHAHVRSTLFLAPPTPNSIDIVHEVNEEFVCMKA